jgi:RNA polymerase sigma-70 factor (ECF subfamily)
MDRAETTALLRRARDGSGPALDELYDRCAVRLLSLIRVRLGPELRASLESRDILQTCLLRSFERIDQLEQSDAASLMAWLARIAENEIRDQVDYHRRQRRDVRRNVPIEGREGLLPDRLRSSLSRLILDEQSLRLERALETLSVAHREVIVLRKLEERSWRETAARLGKTEDACRMLLARAMTALTLLMDEEP